MTFTPASSGIALSRGSSSIEAVMSKVMNSVTCGAVNALSTIACAVALRTPLTGTRRSRVVGSYAGAAATGGASATPSTSARVIVPPGPLPVSCARSTPRSRASLRTGGLARTGMAPADCAAASPTAAAETRAAVAGGGAGRSTGTGAGAAVRGRRVRAPSFGP